MAETTSLSDILSDKPEPAPKPEPQPQPQPTPEPAPKPEAAAPAPEPEREKTGKQQWRDKEAAAQSEGSGMVRDPVTGQFVKKAEPEVAKEPEKQAEPAKPAAPPHQDLTDREKALLAEADRQRHRTKALEQEVARMRQQHQQPQPAAQTEQPKTFWDDPEGALKAHEERLQQTNVTTRLQTAEMLARSRYKDFDEKVAIFANLVQSTPGLAQQWIAAPDPGEFAYATGKNHMMLEQAGSLDSIIEKTRKETEVSLRAKWDQEQKDKQADLERQRAALPPSLSDARGAAAMNRTVFSGPTPMGDILKN